MKQYQDLLKDIIENGSWKEPARPGMPRTKEVFGRMLKFNLQEGFPLLTTKKMFIKGIVAELLWFLNGNTNIRELIEQGVHIWDQDAFKYYLKNPSASHMKKLKKADWLDEIMAGNPTLGDCGKIYGRQWRQWQGGLDQISMLINNIRSNPYSRYHLVTAWNPMDFLEKQCAALPACHLMFQVSIRGGRYLDLIMMQRSCDTFLGVPFNIASYALLCHILADLTGYVAGEFTWIGNSVHLYENHMDAVKEQLSRNPMQLCKLSMVSHKEIEDYCIDDFEFENYVSHPAIKAELSVGV